MKGNKPNRGKRSQSRPAAPWLSAALMAAMLPWAGTLQAEEVATVPSGFVTLDIAAGTGVTRSVSLLSLPLVDTATATGQMIGRISSVTANTIANANAGWTPSELSTAATPHCIRITSGAAAGRTFLISTDPANASTATTVTIDAEEASQANLSILGILTGANGDTYEIIPCDTLSSVFGTPATTGIQGGANSAQADSIQMYVSGAWREFYYNTTTARWSRVGPNFNSNNQPIRPDAAILYNRLGSAPLSLMVMGRAPATDRKAFVNASGVTFLSTGWPVDMTLATAGFHLIPGWVSSPSSDIADRVQMFIGGSWREYYYTGTQWKRVGPNFVSDTVPVAAGTAVLLNKRGVSPTASTLSQSRPYPL